MTPTRIDAWLLSADGKEVIGTWIDRDIDDLWYVCDDLVTFADISWPGRQGGMRDKSIVDNLVSLATWSLRRGHSYDSKFMSGQRIHIGAAGAVPLPHMNPVQSHEPQYRLTMKRASSLGNYVKDDNVAYGTREQIMDILTDPAYAIRSDEGVLTNRNAEAALRDADQGFVTECYGCTVELLGTAPVSSHQQQDMVVIS